MPCTAALARENDGSLSLEIHLPISFCFQSLAALSSLGSMGVTFVTLEWTRWAAFGLGVVITLTCAMLCMLAWFATSKKPGSKEGETTFGQRRTKDVKMPKWRKCEIGENAKLDQASQTEAGEIGENARQMQRPPRNPANPTPSDDYVMDLHRQSQESAWPIVCISKHGDKYHKRDSRCAKEYTCYTACRKCFH